MTATRYRVGEVSHLAVNATVLALATALYYLLGRRSVGQAFVYQVSILAVIAIVVGIRRNRPARPRAWYLLAAGQGAFAMGDLIWNVYRLGLHRELPVPSLADGFYLVAYRCTRWAWSY